MTDNKTVNTAVLVGASRGIGFALAELMLASWPGLRLFAACRSPAAAESLQGLRSTHGDHIVILSCDVTRDDDLARLAEDIRAFGCQPELVIHAAGILHEAGLRPEKALSQVQRNNLQRIFQVNSFAPLLLAQAILPLMPKERPAHFAALSAMVGSIGDNLLGGWYGYRASKAALNQFLKTLAIECRRSHPMLCVTAIHPGTTDTALSRPFQSRLPPDHLYKPEQTAARVLDVILSGEPADSGRFVNWDGGIIPY